MRDIPDKIDNAGDTLPAGDFNALQSEQENLVTTSGSELDPEAGPDSSVEMMGGGFANYINASNCYIANGTNTLVLPPTSYSSPATGALKAPNGYKPNMFIAFRKNGADNTGAVTINIDGLGAKDLTLMDGTALSGGELKQDQDYFCRYNSSSNRFELLNPDYSILPTGHIIESELPIPSGFVQANGQELEVDGYPELYAILGNKYGYNASTNKFRVPTVVSENLDYNFIDHGAPALAWSAVAVNEHNGDVWVTESGGKIYKQTRGIGAFVDVSAPLEGWLGIAHNQITGEFTATASSGKIYKSVDGTTWIDQSAQVEAWRGVAYNENNGDIWVSENGKIFLQKGGIGTFDDQGAPSKNWTDIAYNLSNNHLWACDSSGTIYKSEDYGASWVDQLVTVKSWEGININQNNGDVWASESGGKIYKNEAGAGSFVDQGLLAETWKRFTINNKTGSIIIAASAEQNIYKASSPINLIKT